MWGMGKVCGWVNYRHGGDDPPKASQALPYWSWTLGTFVGVDSFVVLHEPRLDEVVKERDTTLEDV